MERSTVKGKLTEWLKKGARYRYAALVGLLGLILMLLPKNSKTHHEASDSNVSITPTLCEQLEDVLSQIEGAGRVSCILSYREEGRRIYQMDLTQSSSGEVKETTVLMSTGSGTEEAVLVGTTCPVYQGAIIICDGADSATLRLEIVRAVSAITGLGSDQIAVIKRKGNS